MGNKGAKKKKNEPSRNTWPGIPSRSKPSSQEILTQRDIDFLISQTGRSEDEIKDIFDEFIFNNPDGQLNQEEFTQLYTRLRPEPTEMLEKISKFVFRAFDLDRNGTIDFNEFMISYSLTSRGDMKQKLEFAFNIYDSDKNGYLDKNELKQVIYGMLDLLGASQVTHNPDILAEQCIRELDVSNDGKVSKEEFIAGLSRNYSMRALLCPFN